MESAKSNLLLNFIRFPKEFHFIQIKTRIVHHILKLKEKLLMEWFNYLFEI
jgi:hypothetical protein